MLLLLKLMLQLSVGLLQLNGLLLLQGSWLQVDLLWLLLLYLLHWGLDVERLLELRRQ